MKKTKQAKHGLYWHVHHSQTVEFCYNEAERKDYIRTEKPTLERSLRLKLFKPVTIKGAPKRLAKFILGCRAFNANESYMDQLYALARVCGYKTSQTAVSAVLKLHDQQCDPRCPVRGKKSMFMNTLKYRNKSGTYTLAPK